MRRYNGITNEELRNQLDTNIKEMREYGDKILERMDKRQEQLEERLNKGMEELRQNSKESEERLNRGMAELRQHTKESIAESRQLSKEADARLDRDIENLKAEFRGLKMLIVGSVAVPAIIMIGAAFLPIIIDNWRNLNAQPPPAQQLQAEIGSTTE